MSFNKFALVLLGFLFVSCGKPEHIVYGGTPAGQGGPEKEGEVLRYETVNAQVLAVRCATCHAAGGRLLDLSSREALMAEPGLVVPGAPEQSLLYTIIAQGIMPPRNALPADQQELIFRWIQQGAKP